MTEDYSDLPLARLRWRQATGRIAERYPRVARDGQLASILEGLGDALGVGPEATDPERASARAADVWRTQLGPDLWVAVDASLCVVLEVTTTAGRIMRRIVVGRGLAEAVELALGVAGRKTAEDEAARLRGPAEKRRAEGRLTKAEAVDWLVAHQQARGVAVSIAERLCRGGSPVFGMTYSDGYWRVPPNNLRGDSRT